MAATNGSPCKGCNSWSCLDEKCKPVDPFMAQEDDVVTLLQDMPKSKQGMIYKYLFHSGWRVSTVDREIRTNWKREHANPNS